MKIKKKRAITFFSKKRIYKKDLCFNHANTKYPDALKTGVLAGSSHAQEQAASGFIWEDCRARSAEERRIPL